MDTDLIWFIAIVLELGILFRGLRTELRARYPLFYCYVGSLFVLEIARFVCYRFSPGLYQTFYWRTELIRIVASYCVVSEICTRTLRRNPGVARSAQKLLAIIFVVAFTYAACDLLDGGFSSISRGIADLGRYLLYMEAALLLVMLWLFGRYRISFDRNLLGLTLGYSLLAALDIVSLAFLSMPGNGSSVVLRKLIPIAHVITLIVWCVSLWSAQPEVIAPPEHAIDRDYAALAAKTRDTFANLSARVGRTLRP
jgi:hypothetical protein